jgi:hypothetical protein
VYAYVRGSGLTVARSKVLAEASESNHLVDDAGMVDLVNHLVETKVTKTSGLHANIMRVRDKCEPRTYYGLYCRLWLQSKYDSPAALLHTIATTKETWVPHERLGRVIGAFLPLFGNTAEGESYMKLLGESRNDGVRDAYKFHLRLSSEPDVFNSMYDALRNPNPSRGTGITHPKFLRLLSALRNQSVPAARRQHLRTKNVAVYC